ncbi:MAG: hypothetical protein R2729_19725 [Bryobacteraceae bacterium]
MKLYRRLLRQVILPAGDRVFRQGMMERLKFLEQAQWWDRERVDQWRDRALRELVQVCYRDTAFYRGLMDEAGVKPGDIRGLADLPVLPVVTKDMIRAAYPEGVVRDTGLPTYNAGTSGSTGKLFSVREDSETAGTYRASTFLALEWAGWEIGEPHMMTGMNMTRSLDRRFKDAMLGCRYAFAAELRDDQLDRRLDQMEREKIEHLWGYPPAIYFLARRAAQRGWTRPLKSVATWGDMLPPLRRETIEKAFRVRVTDTYGCGEGFQLAAQCGSGVGYHVHAFDVALELVDSAGIPAPDGTPGMVTVTRFHPGPTPFLRYQPGDLATGLGDFACPCGRQWPMLDSIQGRAADTVVTPSGARLMGHVFNKSLQSPEIDSWQVLQRELKSITVRLLLLPGHKYTQELERKLIGNLRRNGAGDDLEIRIDRVDSLPVTKGGKHRFIVSEVEP